MLKCIKHIIIIFSLVAIYSQQLVAQQGTSPVGVNFVLVNFNQPPSFLTVNKAPLKYNKDFALSMQIDDGNLSLYTHGYPVFEGGEVDGTSYPGLYYSDGCGNSHNFKMSSSVFVFLGDSVNGPDIHLDNAYGQLSWEQMDTIYNNNWGILNHGVNSNSSPIPSYIDYSIRRNKSYIRRKLFNATEGGVLPHVFVNPNNNSQWTTPSFNLGYIGALNHNTYFPIGVFGGDVNAPGVNWTQPYSLYRRTADNVNVSDFVDGLANSSVGGANYWCPIFTHSVTNHYLFSDFVTDFTYIANTYGINGLDNILMTSDEEILDYLIVRDTTTLNYVINGTTLLITYSGEVPDDLLYYSSSIVINSDAIISNIIIDGTNDYSFTGIGQTDALINLNWDGNIVIPPEVLADSIVTIAVASQSQYDCWIAMDYVITMVNGSHKDSLRQVLCAIPNTNYDEGFCDCEINIQPADTTINFGDCIDMFGAIGDYTYSWYIGDSLIDTTQNIYRCPVDTTQYNHIATNPFGCPAEDSIMVNINFLSFDLGPDTTICEGNCVTIIGPPDMVNYNWFVADTLYDTVQVIHPCPIDTTQYTLWVEDVYGATAEDSITINVLPSPIINIQPSDTTISYGHCIELFGAVGDYTYQWLVGDSLVDTTQNIYTCPLDTTQYNHIATNSYGCPGEDSIMVNIHFLSFDLGPDITICEGNCTTITGPPNMVLYNWFVADTLYDTVQIIHPCPVETTQYTLWVEDEYGATAEDSIMVYVLPSPTINFEDDSLNVCVGNNVLLTVEASPDVNTFIWSYNGNVAITTTNSYNLVKPMVSGYVYVEGLQDNGCNATDSTYLTVLPYPEIVVSNDTSICSGQPVTLSVSGGSFFLWIVDGDTISTDSTIVVYPVDSTNYIARTAFADSMCYSEDNVIVTVHNSAATEILYDTTIFCTYEEVVLTASGADFYEWIPGGDTNLIYSFIITDTTTIWLTGTTIDGCQQTDSVTNYNLPSPDVSISGLLPSYCENDSGVPLSGTPPGGLFTGPGVIGNNFYPQSAGPGVHIVKYTYTNIEDCTGSDSLITTVYGNSGIIDLGPDFTLLPEDNKILDAGSGFESYFWTTGATTRSITVFGTDKSPGTYEYAVMGVIHGCPTRGSVNITFENPYGYYENHINALIIYPNPNNGNFSIRFNSTEKNIQLSIFNLQGKLVFERDNISCTAESQIDVQLNVARTGFYFLHITTPKGVSIAKIILK
ncbi:MAG: T9SS type A sorting domain-containing protein [Bacteroidetes bacterium]|nr:T9SS type A sorting domain-containing protein [Bacteroidota bacterium]MBL6944462.1 T9SS type A sorting domain-containing protein [Bacteroidales bacterium]